MVLIQHSITQLYLQSYADWTAEAEAAWKFESDAEAARFCQMSGLKDVHLLIPTDADVLRRDVPTNVSFHYRGSSQVPVILPSSELGQN
jgi:hypothetical protein